MPEKNYEIVEHIAVLGENPKSHWTKEINLVKWYGRDAKYDIRDWAPEKEKYGKGVTLTQEEYNAFVQFAQSQMSLDDLELDK